MRFYLLLQMAKKLFKIWERLPLHKKKLGTSETFLNAWPIFDICFLLSNIQKIIKIYYKNLFIHVAHMRPLYLLRTILNVQRNRFCFFSL